MFGVLSFAFTRLEVSNFEMGVHFLQIDADTFILTSFPLHLYLFVELFQGSRHQANILQNLKEILILVLF